MRKDKVNGLNKKKINRVAGYKKVEVLMDIILGLLLLIPLIIYLKYYDISDVLIITILLGSASFLFILSGIRIFRRNNMNK